MVGTSAGTAGRRLSTAGPSCPEAVAERLYLRPDPVPEPVNIRWPEAGGGEGRSHRDPALGAPELPAVLGQRAPGAGDRHRQHVGPGVDRQAEGSVLEWKQLAAGAPRAFRKE